jgi:integrase
VNKPVDKITADEIEEWISDKPQIRATADLMVVVSMIFKFAMTKKKYIKENPAAMVDRPEYIKKMPDPYSKDEMNKIILGIDSHYQDYIEFKFLTGMSSAEVHGLFKENLDFENHLIHIKQTCVNGIVGAPKNAFRMRSIKMNKMVLALLERQISKHSRKYVFINRHYKPINSRNFSRSTWKPLLKKLKIRYRRAYNTRHTFISLALKAGERVDYVARFVGHSSTKMIYECYQAYIPDDRDGTMFEEFITPILPQAVKDENPPFSMSEYLLEKYAKKHGKALT